MKLIKLIVCFLLFSLSITVQAQDVVIDEDKSSKDTTTIVKNAFFKLFTGKPGKAAFYGLIAPGGGQIYNKKWWKLPLVYGIEGFLVYRIVDSSTNYNRYQEAYIANLNGGNIIIDNTNDINIIRRRRNNYRKDREYAYVFFIGGHLITIFEAFIDRHLMDFDVSDDLSFVPIVTEIGLFTGVTYRIPLNKTKEINFNNF
ncbi:MAG: DUF5683 domain-containing protein [Saprospiraceae bacterium]